MRRPASLPSSRPPRRPFHAAASTSISAPPARDRVPAGAPQLLRAPARSLSPGATRPVVGRTRSARLAAGGGPRAGSPAPHPFSPRPPSSPPRVFQNVSQIPPAPPPTSPSPLPPPPFLATPFHQ